MQTDLFNQKNETIAQANAQRLCEKYQAKQYPKHADMSKILKLITQCQIEYADIKWPRKI